MTFQTADKAINDRSWMMSALAISRHLSWCYDDVNLEEIDKQMLSLGCKAYDKHTYDKRYRAWLATLCRSLHSPF